MPKRVREEETFETDRIAGQAHPRETLALIGQEEALGRAARAIRGGRPPQAWLISGPPGIGKATFAYRVARYLLAHGATDKGAQDLSVAPSDSVVTLVRARSHPGLLALKRGLHPETGKLMTVLSIHEIRKLAEFFGLTSAAGGWRVAIVDTADEMSDQAANALLKILEEPPARSMLMLIANTPAMLASTIRSRCQVLRLKPLGDSALAAELDRRLPKLSAEDRARLVALSGGSLGAALRLAEDDGLKLATEAERLIDSAASPDYAATMSMAERIARIDRGPESFGLDLAQILADRILHPGEDGNSRSRTLGGTAQPDHVQLRAHNGIASRAAPDDCLGRARDGSRCAPRCVVIISRVSFSMLVDSHCHLDFPEFAAELPDVVARARAADVGVCVSIGTKLSRFDEVAAIAARFPDVWCTVGSHPHEAETEPLAGSAPLLERARNPKVAGIGETGLDYYYEHSPRAQQQTNFRAHISAARALGLPLVVHTRDAEDDTISILREEMGQGAFTGLIHCFTGTQSLADAALDLGLYISASGIATFKKSEALRDVLKRVPLDRLLVETDAPYLAPVPHRGKTNEPAFVVHTAALLAELKGMSAHELARATTDNFFRLFARATRPTDAK